MFAKKSSMSNIFIAVSGVDRASEQRLGLERTGIKKALRAPCRPCGATKPIEEVASTHTQLTPTARRRKPKHDAPRASVYRAGERRPNDVAKGNPTPPTVAIHTTNTNTHTNTHPQQAKNRIKPRTQTPKPTGCGKRVDCVDS